MIADRFCTIDGKTYRIGDVVLDFTRQKVPKVVLHEIGRRWFVVRANPNCDERAAESMAAHQIEVFRPMTTVERGRLGKKVEVATSLFPRYLFPGLPVNSRGEVDFSLLRRCDGVEGLVRVAGAPAQIQPEIIQALKDAQQGGEFDRPDPYASFEVGGEVRITKGPLAGFLARIGKVEPGKRIEVLLAMFGSMQRIRFEAADLEVV